ncbi:MAG: hypothetical protein FJ316_09380 [SAR202 cluster bacterium]|nr:hypothetical protein [SAR202 cluster bacterium]
MKLENRCLAPVSRDAAWDMVMDIPRVAPCIPGLTEIAPDGPNRYRAAMQVKVGPMSFHLAGTIQVLAQDRDKGEAQFLVDAQERRVGGSVKANLTVQLSAKTPEQTEMIILTDAAFLGRLGELGQPVIRRKAGSAVQEFADNLAKLVAQPKP